jgi:hypothetical protein
MNEIQRKEPNRIPLAKDARNVALDQQGKLTVDLDCNARKCRKFTVA